MEGGGSPIEEQMLLTLDFGPELAKVFRLGSWIFSTVMFPRSDALPMFGVDLVAGRSGISVAIADQLLTHPSGDRTLPVYHNWRSIT
jgi:hypothetical protein